MAASRTPAPDIRLYGTSADEDFYGSNFDNLFYGSGGADTYDGAGGVDTINHRYSTEGVTVNLGRGYGKGGTADGDTYVSIENVTGSNYADRLYGSADDNRLDGLNGNDSLYGLTGDDALYGGAGNDFLDGGDGADIINGGSGIDTATYRGSSMGVSIDLATGTASGGWANGDVISSIENVTGSYWYADTLGGNAANNVLDGLGGDDTFIGTTGDDTIIGGAGSDILDYSGLSDGIYIHLGSETCAKRGGNGTDTVSGVETVIGTDFKDYFSGTSSNDTFFGGAGYDVFFANNFGADHYDGGDGIDAVDYTNAYNADEGITVNLITGTGEGGHAEGDTYVSIADVFGSELDDVLIGNDADNYLVGGLGDDILIGGDGNDVLYGHEGIDQIDGGAGFDIAVHVNLASYFGSDAWVTIDLAAETVSITESGVTSVHETFTGIEGLKSLGSGLTLIGDGGDNLFDVESTDTLIDAGGGNDTIIKGLLGTDIDGGAGTDSVEYYFATGAQGGSRLGLEIDLAAGTVQSLYDETLPGDQLASIENVSGSALDDIILGNNADNVIDGLYGNDFINGGRGDDTLTGNTGSDVFVFVNRQSDSDDDVITDFMAGFDRIDFSDDDNFIDDFAEFQQYSDQVGDDVVIDTGQGSITLLDVQLADLSESDFLF